MWLTSVQTRFVQTQPTVSAAQNRPESEPDQSPLGRAEIGISGALVVFVRMPACLGTYTQGLFLKLVKYKTYFKN